MFAKELPGLSIGHEWGGLFWAYGKNYVADMYFPSRSMLETREALRVGWYGGTKDMGTKHNPCDCSSLIAHSLKEAQKALDADELLSGKLGVSIVASENDREEARNVDTSREGGDDPNFNDSLFVEDDCDEFVEELDE